MSNMRIIRVTGKGQIKVHPDMTRITMTLEGLYPEYADTLRRSSEDTERLKDVLVPFGFERSDLKTLNLSIDAEYERYDHNGNCKYRFVGYKYLHSLKMEFDSDNERLGRILYALAHSPVRPEIRISYTVKDPESVKNTLLGKAITDAMQKAAVLTQAAGTRLGELQTIDYSWGEISFESRPMNRNLLLEECTSPSIKMESYDLDMEPDDIDVSDTVTVVWQIV